LAQDDLEKLALAIPTVEKVDVDRPTDTRGSDDYYHLLPLSYPDVDFSVCIEEDQLDHRNIDIYEDRMNIVVVDSIDEYVCISDLEVYFMEGVTRHSGVTQGKTNRCTYDDTIQACVHSLFDVKDVLRSS